MADVRLALSGDEALVLFELLARRAEAGGRLEVRHEGEERALDALEAALEAQLAEPFASDYRDLVAHALKRLAAVSGEVA